jgi:hypothetical protein
MVIVSYCPTYARRQRNGVYPARLYHCPCGGPGLLIRPVVGRGARRSLGLRLSEVETAWLVFFLGLVLRPGHLVGWLRVSQPASQQRVRAPALAPTQLLTRVDPSIVTNTISPQPNHPCRTAASALYPSHSPQKPAHESITHDRPPLGKQPIQLALVQVRSSGATSLVVTAVALHATSFPPPPPLLSLYSPALCVRVCFADRVSLETFTRVRVVRAVLGTTL